MTNQEIKLKEIIDNIIKTSTNDEIDQLYQVYNVKEIELYLGRNTEQYIELDEWLKNLTPTLKEKVKPILALIDKQETVKPKITRKKLPKEEYIKLFPLIDQMRKEGKSYGKIKKELGVQHPEMKMGTLICKYIENKKKQ